jgi:hypothetical protein
LVSGVAVGVTVEDGIGEGVSVGKMAVAVGARVEVGADVGAGAAQLAGTKIRSRVGRSWRVMSIPLGECPLLF